VPIHTTVAHLPSPPSEWKNESTLWGQWVSNRCPVLTACVLPFHHHPTPYIHFNILNVASRHDPMIEHTDILCLCFCFCRHSNACRVRTFSASTVMSSSMKSSIRVLVVQPSERSRSSVTSIIDSVSITIAS